MNAQQPFKLARWCASNATTKSPKLPFYRRSKVVAGSSVVLLSGGTAAYLLSHPPAPASPLTNEGIRSPLELLDAAHLRNSTAHLEGLTATELLRSWLTYTLCTSSTLVTWSPAMIDALRSFKDTVPVLGPLTWHVFCGVMRQTIFACFVGGESDSGCQPVIRKFLDRNIATLSAYAAEIDQASPPGQDGADRYLFTENVDIYKRSIIQAAQATTAEPSADIKPTWVGIRFNGITRDPTVLTRASKALDEDPNCYGFPEKSPHLSQDDQDALHYLYEACRDLEATARNNGLRVDWASDIWPFQPAIDRLNRLLRDEFDKIGNASGCDEPTVFNTYQCYLTSSPERLRQDMAHAQQHGTTFGAKLVRGAYLDAENRRAVEADIVSPCHPTKEDTDKCYDDLVRLMTDAVLLDIQENPKGRPKAAVAVCTNNVLSVRKVCEYLVEKGLMTPQGDKIVVDERLRGRLVFGQLMGMSDALTGTLASIFVRPEDADLEQPAMPLVFKFAPWGPVDLSLPYLLRRALENKSVLAGGTNAGGAVAEARAARKEIKRRLRLI